LITQDRTASQLAHETRQVSEAMNVVLQLLCESTQEELERNEELLRSLRDLRQELETLPGNLGERAKRTFSFVPGVITVADCRVGNFGQS